MVNTVIPVEMLYADDLVLIAEIKELKHSLERTERMTIIIIIIIMKFYSLVSNTRCHSIGHKMRIARIKIRVDSQGRWERAYGGNAILKRCVLSLERKTGREFEFRVSGGSEFQSRGPMTENALLPSDDLTYGMERTSESEDLVETECDGNEKLL